MRDMLLHALIAYGHEAHSVFERQRKEAADRRIDAMMRESPGYAVAVDFDGTLCENKWPQIGRPHDVMIRAVKEARARGARLILYTCREGERLAEAAAWCEAQGIHFDAVNENLPEWIAQYGGDCRKISCHELWDDLAVTVPEFEPERP